LREQLHTRLVGDCWRTTPPKFGAYRTVTAKLTLSCPCEQPVRPAGAGVKIAVRENRSYPPDAECRVGQVSMADPMRGNGATQRLAATACRWLLLGVPGPVRTTTA